MIIHFLHNVIIPVVCLSATLLKYVVRDRYESNNAKSAENIRTFAFDRIPISFLGSLFPAPVHPNHPRVVPRNCSYCVQRRAERMGGELRSLAFVAVACLLAQRLSLSRAFYIPGVAPTEYADGQKLDIKVKARAIRVFEGYRIY